LGCRGGSLRRAAGCEDSGRTRRAASLAQLSLSPIKVYRFRKVALYYRYGSFAFRALD